MIGKILGQYEIESRLGAGGMGEVYRARDTRLGRSVAIKLLPEAFVGDRDRAARFEREAKALAALNHPNVATLYGFEESNGAYFLAMELIEGETLSERIARGPIAVDEALRILQQIAEALEAAHAKGIIHRDLKPGNVKITPEGVVKVLDFGLAKALNPSQAPTTLSNSPTAMDSGAATGVILGTAGYMSPEQAKGRSADERSDVFSFGCVLYEMLTGVRPFPGDSFPEVMAGVIAREPDLSKLPVNLNPRVPELLRRCLDKDPRRRWHAIADARVEIAAILADPQGSLIERPESKGRSARQRAVAMVAALLIGAVIAAPAIWFYNAAPARTVKRFTFTLQELPFTNLGRQFLSIAPDGSQFVYTARGQLHLKLLRELDPITIQGQPQGNLFNPVFSPDGKSIVYISSSDGTLKRVPAAGGAPVTLCSVEPLFGMSWGKDDQILFGQSPGGILRVSASAGKPEVIIPAAKGEVLHGPQLLPDGNSILFTVMDESAGWEKAKIVVQTPGSNDRKVLVENATDGRYLPTGHLVYYSGGNLLAVPFDSKKLTVLGRAVPVVEGVRFSNGAQTGSAEFSVSNTGTLIYVEGPPPVQSVAQGAAPGALTVALLNTSGNITPTALLPNSYVAVRLSPSGKQIAVGTDDGKEANIWVYDLDGKAAIRRLTFGGRNLYPLWSGDGERILYQSDRERDKGIFWQRADGAGVAERITRPEKDAEHMPESWLPGSKDNGKFSFRITTSGRQAIWLYSIADKMATPLIADSGFNQRSSAFSLDGKWIAYHSDERGSTGLYVQPFPTAGGAKYLIDSNPTASNPSWLPDGTKVIYHGNTRFNIVRIKTQPAFTASAKVTAAPLPFERDYDVRKYDIGAVGVVMITSQAPDAATTAAPDVPHEIRVVLNWFEELNRLVPAR